ncbi:MAG: phospholipid carrier-dependent glycosyltransferase [Chloroflexi bacterium]|nr:phospholipid carrier-dependent glycosyltransferase [Chloroflexota bacterium]
MMKKFVRESLPPVFLFLFFLAATIPGITWGLPALWKPDELVWRVSSALRGEIVFDVTEPDFNYPSLPKYVMFAVGKIVYGLGFADYAFFTAARLVSALLGAAAAALTYFMARDLGASRRFSTLAGLLYIASGIASANARFAHNDLYLQFFTVLCVFFALKYQLTKKSAWIFASFYAAGLAASSKYTGGSMTLLSLFVLFAMNWAERRADWRRSLGALALGGALSFGGYVTGTPRAIDFFNYMSRALPAMQRFALYGKNSGVPIGLYGQWEAFKVTVGAFAYYLFLFGFLWFAVKLMLKRMGKIRADEKRSQGVLILLAAVVIFDLPFLISVNYVMRFFIPFVPFLSVLSALCVEEIFAWARPKWRFAPAVITVGLGAGVFYSTLQLASIALLFMNDARIPASEYIADFRGYKKTIEYTLYPPRIDKKQFYGAARNYPIYFVKYPGEQVPTGGKVKYNQGEAGLIERNVDYFVIDSFTYDRLYNDAICATNPVECDFFKRLLAGEATAFRLMAEFHYSLPSWLPQVSVLTVNPDIKIYERVR